MIFLNVKKQILLFGVGEGRRIYEDEIIAFFCLREPGKAVLLNKFMIAQVKTIEYEIVFRPVKQRLMKDQRWLWKEAPPFAARTVAVPV